MDFVSGKRKIAYAPSMGDYLLLDNDREKMRKALEEFYAISVREASMIQMLEQLNLPISIQTVVDPTLLLKKGRLYSRAKTGENGISGKVYFCIYTWWYESLWQYRK
ncbi:MAG: polysaccharide pyruvyl transferase family protein [Mediterraneibacter faecis]